MKRGENKIYKSDGPSSTGGCDGEKTWKMVSPSGGPVGKREYKNGSKRCRHKPGVSWRGELLGVGRFHNRISRGKSSPPRWMYRRHREKEFQRRLRQYSERKDERPTGGTDGEMRREGDSANRAVQVGSQESWKDTGLPIQESGTYQGQKTEFRYAGLVAPRHRAGRNVDKGFNGTWMEL